MLTFSEYFDESIDWQVLDEAGLSRILTHIDTRNMGIVTAFRGGSSGKLAENRQRNRQLQQEIRKAGFGYLRLIGSYPENEGTPEEEQVVEESMLVIGSDGDDNGALLGFLRRAGAKWNQESVVFKPWNSTQANLVLMSNPRTLVPIGTFSLNPQNIGKMYSKFKGHPFVFHSLSERRSFMSRLAYQKGYRASS